MKYQPWKLRAMALVVIQAKRHKDIRYDVFIAALSAKAGVSPADAHRFTERLSRLGRI